MSVYEFSGLCCTCSRVHITVLIVTVFADIAHHSAVIENSEDSAVFGQVSGRVLLRYKYPCPAPYIKILFPILLSYQFLL